MILKDKDYLPMDAVPYFIRLVTLYNKSLEELSELFATQKNELAFAKLLHHLVDDFEYYEGTYEHWKSEAKTDADHCSLEVLKPLLAESKKLLASAIALVKH